MTIYVTPLVYCFLGRGLASPIGLGAYLQLSFATITRCMNVTWSGAQELNLHPWVYITLQPTALQMLTPVMALSKVGLTLPKTYP